MFHVKPKILGTVQNISKIKNQTMQTCLREDEIFILEWAEHPLASDRSCECSESACNARGAESPWDSFSTDRSNE